MKNCPVFTLNYETFSRSTELNETKKKKMSFGRSDSPFVRSRDYGVFFDRPIYHLFYAPRFLRFSFFISLFSDFSELYRDGKRNKSNRN